MDILATRLPDSLRSPRIGWSIGWRELYEHEYAGKLDEARPRYKHTANFDWSAENGYAKEPRRHRPHPAVVASPEARAETPQTRLAPSLEQSGGVVSGLGTAGVA